MPRAGFDWGEEERGRFFEEMDKMSPKERSKILSDYPSTCEDQCPKYECRNTGWGYVEDKRIREFEEIDRCVQRNARILYLPRVKTHVLSVRLDVL